MPDWIRLEIVWNSSGIRLEFEIRDFPRLPNRFHQKQPFVSPPSHKEQ